MAACVACGENDALTHACALRTRWGTSRRRRCTPQARPLRRLRRERLRAARRATFCRATATLSPLLRSRTVTQACSTHGSVTRMLMLHSAPVRVQAT